MVQFIQKAGVDPATGESYKPIDLMKAINPNTGALFSGLQEASDVGGYSPVANTVIGIDNNNNNIDQGTDEIEDKLNILSSQEKEAGQTGEVDTSGVDLGSAYADLQEEYESSRRLSESEIQAIEEEQERIVSGQYDPLISEAQEREKFGQAKNIVATGRRGGFQRTRYAGEAALGATVGDVGYEGSGGALEESRSAYQRNINNLKDQKARALSLAKAQAKQAALSGKANDFAAATKMFELAKQMDAEARDKEQQMWDNMFKMRQEERAERGEDRLGERLEFDKDKFLIGEERLNRTSDLAEAKFNYEISQDMENKTIDNIKKMANGLKPLEEMSDEQIRGLEYEAGLESGTFEAFYSSLLEDRQRGLILSDLSIKQKQASIAKAQRIPAGKTTEAGDGMIRAGQLQIPDTGNTFTDTVNYLKAMRQQGEDYFNDYTWKQQISALMLDGDYNESQRGEVEKMVQDAMRVIGEDNIGSEYSSEDDTPVVENTYGEEGLGTFGTGEGIEGLRNYGESYWNTLTDVDKSKFLPKAWIKKGWKEVSKYLFGK